MDDAWDDFFDSQPNESTGKDGMKAPPSSSREQDEGNFKSHTSGSKTANGQCNPSAERTDPQEDKARRKIEAKVPNMTPLSSSDSESESDPRHEKKSQNQTVKGKKYSYNTASGKNKHYSRDSRDDVRVSASPSDSKENQREGNARGSREELRSSSSRQYSSSRSSSFSSNSSENSDVTDVSPLQTPAYTPQSKKYLSSDLDRYTRKPPTPKRPPKGSQPHYDEYERATDKIQSMIDNKGGALNMEVLMQAMMEIGGDSSRDPTTDKGHVRFNAPQIEDRNYSFSVDKAKAIDRENQRLLEKLMRYEKGFIPGQKPMKRTEKMKKPPPKLTPSAVNRQRELERIERENYFILKRLHKARPTTTLARDSLLRDYNNKTIAGHSVAGAHYRQQKSRTARAVMQHFPQQMEETVQEHSLSRPQSAYPEGLSSHSRPVSAKTRPWSASQRSETDSEFNVPRNHFPKPRPAWDSRW